MQRRKFIKTTAAASAAMAIMPSFACSETDPKTGLILYTVRGEMNTDALGTLDKIAEIGYNWLEAASYSDGKFYGMKPAEFRRVIGERGMELISSHNGLSPENLDEVVGAAAEAGLKYLVMPSLPGKWMRSLDAYREAADFMNKAGIKCKDAGMKLGFHNHHGEFIPIDDQIPYDILVENTDPDLVCFQVDLAWIQKGEQSAVDYFKKYPGRFELWHIKDLSDDLRDATLGEGNVDFVPIFEQSKLAGMKYFFVEQDSSRKRTPLENIRISRDYLLSNII